MENITVYSTQVCSYCHAAKALLKREGLAFTEVDLSRDPAQRADIMARTKSRTVPQIFFGEQHIGGYQELNLYLKNC